MQDLQYHAALTAKLIDAIKSIPVQDKQGTNHRQWTDGTTVWKFIDGELCVKLSSNGSWQKSIYDNLEELRSYYSITEVQANNTGFTQTS